MNQVFHQNISLEQLIEESTYILIAKKTDPFITSEKISILPDGSKFENKNNPPYYEPPYHNSDLSKNKERNFPPYIKTAYNFKIKEILHSGRVELKNNLISVDEASSNFKLDLHKGFYLNGMRKSPIMESYESSLDYNKYESSDELIIFLSYRLKPFKLKFVVENAYESVDLKEKIVNLIKSVKK